MVYSGLMARPGWLFGLVAVACGPSVSSIYEANIRFEHCYRLDLDPKVAPGHRTTCWKEWSRRYTYGQTRDRLEYARRRISALESGDVGRPELDLSNIDAGPGTADDPGPISVHAPPPRTLAKAEADGGPPDAGVEIHPDAAPRDPPGAACANDCRSSWRACAEVCNPDAGNKRGSCKFCDSDYGRCVQRCYR